MSFFSNLYNIVVGKTNEAVNGSLTTALNERGALEAPENIITVLTCWKILSETISRVPLEIYKRGNRGGKVKFKDHPLYDFLHNAPNGFTTSQYFLETLEMIRNAKGNAFAKINRNGNGIITGIDLLRGYTITAAKIVGDQLYYLSFDNNGNKKVLNASDVLHVRWPGKNGIFGINPIEAARTNLEVIHEAQQTTRNFYKNNATVPKALKSEAGSGVAYEKIRAATQEFIENYGGSANAGKMAALPPNTEVQDITMSFADAEFILMIKFNTGQIGSLYGIPPHLIALYEASKFNNVEQLQLNFKVNAIAAIARHYRQELEFKLLTDKERKEGVTIEFNLDGLVETDYITKITGLKEVASMGAISPNEIARILNLPATDSEAGEKHYMQQQYEPIDNKLTFKNE